MRPSPPFDNVSTYIANYNVLNQNHTLAGRFLQKSHRLLEATLPVTPACQDIIEVGAGTGHHFGHVKRPFRQYVMSDANQEMLAAARNTYRDALNKGNLVIEQQDATHLTYPDARFDQLIATHVLEHLPQPVDVLQEWSRVVKREGLISIVLPCDPGLLWRLGRHFGPRRNAERAGIAYDYLQATEHINSIFNLVVLIRHHFDVIAELWYPSRFALPDLNLFYICHMRP